MSRKKLAVTGITIIAICQMASNHLLWDRPVLRGDIHIMGWAVMAGLIIWGRSEKAPN